VTTEDQRNRAQELILLGEIKGLVQGLKDGQDALGARVNDMSARLSNMEDNLNERIDGIDKRLRVVEQKAAIAGAMSGGAMAVGTALIIEGLKAWLGRGGPTP
jgi:hypothetical protein